MFGENMYFSYDNNIVMCRSVISDINQPMAYCNQTPTLSPIPEEPTSQCNATSNSCFKIFSNVDIGYKKKNSKSEQFPY